MPTTKRTRRKLNPAGQQRAMQVTAAFKNMRRLADLYTLAVTAINRDGGEAAGAFAPNCALYLLLSPPLVLLYAVLCRGSVFCCGGSNG
jgi:hypothetical protein